MASPRRRSASRSRPGRCSSSWGGWVSAFVLIPCLVASVALTQVLGRRGTLPWPGDLLWPVVAGIVLMAAGIGLRIWSIATLGRFFQYWIQVQPGHRVVTGGPYRYVRHPSY